MGITPLCIYSSLINCFIKVIFLRFYNKFKFHILSRDVKMLGLSPSIKISTSSKSGHDTFVLSTIDVLSDMLQITNLSLVNCSHRLQTRADDSKAAGVRKSRIFNISSSGKLQISTLINDVITAHNPLNIIAIETKPSNLVKLYLLDTCGAS